MTFDCSNNTQLDNFSCDDLCATFSDVDAWSAAAMILLTQLAQCQVT